MPRPVAPQRQPITASIERDIKQAVDRLTSSIHDEMNSGGDSNDQDEEDKQPPRHLSPAAALERKKRRYLWLFVTILALTVFAIWFINVATVIFDVKHGDSQEKQLYNEANSAMKKAFASFSIQKEPAPETTPAPVATSTIETITDTLKVFFQNTTTTKSSSTPE